MSYVLNNTPHQVIPEPTRQRVLAAAAELGYTPSATARALVKGRSDVVLLLLPDWPIGPNIGRLLEYLSAALADQGLTFVTHPRSARRPVSDVWRAITPAAVLTFGNLDDEDAALLEAAGIDLVVALFGRHGPRSLDTLEQRNGRLQAEHLVVADHRHLGYAWPDDPRLLTFARPRLEGVRQACAELRLPEPQILTVPLTPEGAALAVRQWRAASPAVTGICAYNDEVALAVLAGAHQAMVDVPRELAVVGIDDIPSAALALPPLTTVRVENKALAQHLAETIVCRLEGRPAPRRPGSDIHSVICRASA